MGALAVPRGRMSSETDEHIPTCPCCTRVMPAPPVEPGQQKVTRSMAHIAAEVAETYGIPLQELRGPGRPRGLAWARQEAMHRIRTETGNSWTKIGNYFNRDHTTVIYAIRAHDRRQQARA